MLILHKITLFFATETNTIEFQKTKKEKEILMKERNALQIEHDALTATQNETASTLQETMLLHQKATATIETHDQHVQKVTKKMVNIYFFTLTTLQNQKNKKKSINKN